MNAMLKSIRKRKLQTILSLVVMAFLSAFVLFGTVVEASNDDFGLNVSIKKDKLSYIFDVEVQNKASAFEGRVVVVAYDNISGSTGFSKAISISAESKEYVSINVPIEGIDPNAQFFIYILDKKDNTEYQEKFKSISDMMGKEQYTRSKTSNLDIYDIDGIQGFMEKPAGELSGVLCILIVLYVALVGPFIYLILKAINKRELLWIVIPGITVVFLLIMYLMGLSTTAKEDSIKSIELVNYQAQSTSTYVFGYSPSPRKWAVKTKENYCAGRAMSDRYYGVDNKQYRSELQEGLSNMILSYSPKNNYETVCFELMSDKKPEGSIKIEATTASEITATNCTGQHLDYLFVSTAYGYDVVEDVDPDETVKIPANFSNQSYGDILNKNKLRDVYIRPAYEDGDLEEAGEIAAMYLAAEAAYSGNAEALAIGVTKGPSKTDREEKSYRCFYDSIEYPVVEDY